jgi:beta-glucanase (GH16 family)
LYGTMTARMAFPPSNTNTWPAIWMLATNCQASNILPGDTPYGSCPGYLQPGYEEIDWIECYQGGNWCLLNILSDGQATLCHWTLSDSNFHDYTMAWTPSGISLSKDGVQVCSIGPPTPSVPMFVILQTQTGGVSGTPNNGNLPTTLTLQNLRVTQP